jgi:hypothetical protein
LAAPSLRRLATTLVVSTLAVPGAAQGPVYQSEPPVTFRADGFYRNEWTRDLFVGDDQTRWRAQLRPLLQVSAGALELGVGGDFNWSDTDNTEPPEGESSLRLQRDNFSSRDARLDRAFARLEPLSWLEVEGGRFAMPLGITEMIWDRDVRAQGAALTLRAFQLAGLEQVSITGLGSRGGHVFDDVGVNTVMVAAFVDTGGLELTGSFIRFTDLEQMDPSLRRQNSRNAQGGYLYDQYDVVDTVARLAREGALTTELVVDYAWNTAADDLNRGLWIRLRLGSLEFARATMEYTFADVDRDVTLAAYATDDFIWSTGWVGHRGDLELKVTQNSFLKFTAQWQRFTAAATAAERDHWVKRYRVDVQVQY